VDASGFVVRKQLKEDLIKTSEKRLKEFTEDWNQADDDTKIELKSLIKIERRKLMYWTDPERMYPEKFFASRCGDGTRKWEKALGRTLVETFGIHSLIDFGCGVGFHIAGAAESGAKVMGIELFHGFAQKYTDDSIRDYIAYGDVGSKLVCGEWDCVLSIEVAEHLPEEEADIFVENVIRAMGRIAVITSSWRPYRYHLNPQKPEYWIEKFKERGSIFLEDEYGRLAKAWRNIGVLDYFIDKMMVFGK